LNVSVLIATYGEAHWQELAQRAAGSAANAGAEEVISEYQPEGTIASARNAAAERAQGDWFCFLDADDELDPSYFFHMRRAVEQENGASRSLLFTPAVLQIRSGRRTRRPFFFPECSFETGNWIVIGTLVSRDLFFKVGGFHDFPHGVEDWNFWARCVRAGARVVKVKRAIYVAHYSRDSKHHRLQRDRAAWLEAYHAALEDAWG
jgi:glycosyltransferase involved in cell wall biosynthesis